MQCEPHPKAAGKGMGTCKRRSFGKGLAPTTTRKQNCLQFAEFFPMLLLDAQEFISLGYLPHYDDPVFCGQARLRESYWELHCRGEQSHCLVVFVSHRWLDAARSLPDTPRGCVPNTKVKEVHYLAKLFADVVSVCVLQ